MLTVQHLGAGARRNGRLIHGDPDVYRLLDALHARFGPRLLAYCIMDTHLHLIVEGDRDENAALLASVLRAYGQSFLRRNRLAPPLLRAPVNVVAAPDEFELARQIRYVHANPVPKLTKKALLYERSSARAFVGLAATPYPNVARVKELLGGELRLVVPGEVKLADPAAPGTGVGLELIVAATCRALGVLPEEVKNHGRSSRVIEARAVAVAVARLEGHAARATAEALGVTRPRVIQLRAFAPRLDAIVAVRSLLRLPSLRERLLPRTPEGAPA